MIVSVDSVLSAFCPSMLLPKEDRISKTIIGFNIFIVSTGIYCCQRLASRSAPRAWQKDTKIAQLPNTHNGIYKELRLEVKIQKQDSC